ncbi:dimeric dUTPase (all-alpha-NTP-PPase superfamily) [Mycoplasmoides fastidiosum]|uniref:Dimeric dUTPase (All-alpha-NTP-PPase superfamily) n=1 Tax=Mycoplasmoides fastidiosum TaxID=92758 RepID=A0ABU0LZN1_9BACT|nr:dUTP diphosphatase [Mycoplasmoides fastidiosum]MDQ0514139.1 dimeric dUTPase (all-alpha-NTP-PPase superfamily) [Mycoplasmoides fastidiosum]UUD37453.1 dUTP diphosphatase [Mycoplasmoides fastidiosum]
MSQTLKWNLQPLLLKQAQLDHYIHTKKALNYQQTFVERLLALVVELNELANETKCFKYWSANKQINVDHILEEYVDGLHFLLSLMLYYELDPELTIAPTPKSDDQVLSQVFLELNQTFWQTAQKNTFLTWFTKYLTLAFQLGFDQVQVETIYQKKWAINLARQDNGY